ncbi:MAG: arginine repressor [Armatimonadota bacterium]|nr:arginine repressor [Armatimonadota bacterium]MDR5697189.1 arginine repressor [Armatimonadota bacterium]
MSRERRERAILEIVAGRPVGRQQDLVAALRRRGFDATQATVSRDIKRLGLVKIRDRDGRYRYAAPPSQPRPTPKAQEKLQDAFEEFVTGLDTGEAVLLVKTLSGRANAVAVAIDEAQLPGVAGTVAGDDTIIVVLRTARERGAVMKAFQSLLR